MTVSREYKYEWNELYLKCTKCWKWLTTNSFYKSSSKKFWVQTDCKECHRLNRRQYHIRNRGEDNLRSREYYKTNKLRIDELNKKYRLMNRDKICLLLKNYRESRSNDVWFNWNTFHNREKRYVNKFWISKGSCSICWNNKNIVMHHPSYESYDDWSRVVFCCRSCHKLIHSGTLECPEPIDLLNLTK